MRVYVDERRKARDIGLRPEKENALLAEKRVAAADALVAAKARDIAQAEAERDRDTSALEAELKRVGQAPVKHGNDTENEYSQKLTKFHVAETQAQRRATFASLDSQYIAGSSDPAEVAGVIEEWSASADTDAARRVLRVAGMRLQALAEAEARAGVAGGPAFIAHVTAQTKIKSWLSAQERQSAAYRRSDILSRHALRVAEIEQHVSNVRRSFELDGPYGQFQR